MNLNEITVGNAVDLLPQIPEGTVHCCVTTAIGALNMGCHYYGTEISADSVELAGNILIMKTSQASLGLVT